MAGRLRILFDKLRRMLSAFGRATLGLILQTHAARLAIMVWRMRRPAPLPALLVAAVFLLCLRLGWAAGRTVWTALLPASPTGIAAGLAAGLAGLAVLELTAALAVTFATAGLQLAYDIGRHRVLAVLALASVAALLVTSWRFAGAQPAGLFDLALPFLATAGLVAMTIWFERAYLKPAYPGFRDFWADIVAARHFLNRAAHAE